MEIEDQIWGKFDIKEKVLTEIIAHPEFKRLDKISQFGLPYEYYPLPQLAKTENFTRYEHSIGVMLFLKRLEANLEEQVSGLIHDVSHTSFSHLVDWITGNQKNEDLQDNRHSTYLASSGLKKILEKHGFDINELSSYAKYTLLERPSPELCADRVDYAMREFKDWANPEIVESCVEGLINHNGRIAFSSEKDARDFAYSYMKLQREHWGGAEWMLRWQIFADALKYSLDKKIISFEDFSSDDAQVLEKLEKSGDGWVLQTLYMLRNPLRFEINNRVYDYKLKKKFRHIDPSYLENGNLRNLSETDSEYRSFLDREREHNSQGFSIKLL